MLLESIFNINIKNYYLNEEGVVGYEVQLYNKRTEDLEYLYIYKTSPLNYRVGIDTTISQDSLEMILREYLNLKLFFKDIFHFITNNSIQL